MQLPIRPDMSGVPAGLAARHGLDQDAPRAGSAARRLGLGLVGTMATMIWMWSLSPPPL